MNFDVIVTGAGPAGCAAAYDLALSGRSVLLLERRQFPRVKPCAGGITVKSLKRLRYSIDPVVRQVCTDIRLGRGLDASAQFRSTHPICSMTVRAEFDAFCLEQTIARGVQLRNAPVTRVDETPDRVKVETAAGEFSARYLVGADGVNSVVRRCLHGRAPRSLAFAIEGQVHCAQMPPMTFDFGIATDGYGWLFPKDDHVNVGLYTSTTRSLPGRQELETYARAKLGAARVEHIVGCYIGAGDGAQPPGSARVILAGDAAGLVEPLLGEGIHNALASGQAAAAAVVDADANRESLSHAYARGIRAMRAELRITKTIAASFYRHLELGYRLTTLLAQRGLLRAYAKGVTLSALSAKSYAQ
jgi:geranylgeranyl reductase family protein